MEPYTGRTHQLRVHALHIGHPIIGDPKYFDADHNWDFPGGVQKKLHLHARKHRRSASGRRAPDRHRALPPHMVQSWNLIGFDIAEAEGRPTNETRSFRLRRYAGRQRRADP
jgi:23S rRNA pseudouridine955/2504/2580 synthase